MRSEAPSRVWNDDKKRWREMMCKFRSNIVKNCRKCKAGYRKHCPIRKKKK